MNVLIVQINPMPINIEYNRDKIKGILENINKDIDLVIFPKLFLYGYHKFDSLKTSPFIEKQIENALEEIRKTAKNNVLISYPKLKENKYTTEFALISNNEIKICDTFKINNKSFKVIENPEDENEIEQDYVIYPELSISRTNEEYKRQNKFKNFIQKHSKKIIFINQAGANGEVVYDGLSRVLDENGKIIALAKAFEEDVLNVNLDKGTRIEKIPKEYSLATNLNSFSLDYENDLERTYNSIILSIRDYFYKNGFKKAVLGLSGGLDSTVCAVLLADALQSKNVLGVSMPSKLTSDLSKSDAYQLAKNLEIGFIEIPIKDYQEAFTKDFNSAFEKISNYWCNRYTNSYTQDNIQARSRAMILWGIANEYAQTLPIATSDKSEAYMGYATINGDMSGGFAPIIDVTKTKLFALAKWMNKNREVKNAIPESIILKPPGAELAIDPKTGQTLKAEDALMPYEFLDEVIWRMENLHQSIDNMMRDEFLYEKNNIINEETKKAWLEKFFKRLQGAKYKWYISAPGPIVDSNSRNKIEFNQPIVSNICYEK